MKNTINGRVRELRLARGYTQDELAKKVGYSGRAMISQIEQGLIKVPTDKAMALAKALDVPVTYLLGIDEPDTNYYREYIYDLFVKLNEDGKRNAQEYLEMLVNNPKYIKTDK